MTVDVKKTARRRSGILARRKARQSLKPADTVSKLKKKGVDAKDLKHVQIASDFLEVKSGRGPRPR
jgi:hypothetical protein